MTEFYANANGNRVKDGSVLFPYYGAPVADLVLADPVTLTNPVTLDLGNLSQTCAAYRQDTFAGTASARLVGGAGGWGKIVPARAYANPKGVALSMILRDVAAEVGESVVLASDSSVGLFYARESAPAQRVLRQLAGELWWIDTQGRTQVGPRPATTIKTEAVVETFSGGKGWLRVMTADPASWMPGATFSGPTLPAPITIAATRFRFDNDGILRLEVLTVDTAIPSELGQPTANDRALAALRSIIRSEDPERVPAGVWEYQVESATPTTFDGSPTSQDFPLPPIVGVPYRSSFAGATCKPSVGTLAYVTFANQSPARPLLIAFGPTTAESVALDATDAVNVGPSAAITRLGSGTSAVPIGLEIERFVRYGDNVSIPVSGVVAQGPIVQNPLTAPNPIARVRG